MQGKKSVILYVDWITTFEELEDDEAGRLIKHFLRYVNDLNPIAPDKLTKIAFEPIKQQLKRDLLKWEGTRESRIEAGRNGGIKSGEARRKQKEANEANASLSKQNEANEAVIVTVNVNGTVNGKNINISFDEFWDLYDKKRGEKEKLTKKWNNLSDAERVLIMEYIPKYKLTTPDKQYRKDPETFLNQKTWTHELIGLNGKEPELFTNPNNPFLP